MRRQFHIAIMAGAASLLVLGNTPVRAQESPTLEDEASQAQRRLRTIREFEGWLRDAEAARLRGECAAVAERYRVFQRLHATPGSIEAQILADFRSRMQVIALRECPPGSGRPSVSLPAAEPASEPAPGAPAAVTPLPPAPAGAVGTLPSTSTTPPAASMWDGTDEAPVGPAGSPAPGQPATGTLPVQPPIPRTPMPPRDADSGQLDDPVMAQEAALDLIERNLRDAEEARLRGDCYNFRDQLSDAGSSLGEFSSGTRPWLSPQVAADLRARLAAARALQCPPPGVIALPSPYDRPPVPPTAAPAPEPDTPPPVIGYVQTLAPLTAGIDAAIGNCDRAAFLAAKNRVLEALGRLLTQSPNDPFLLAERRRIEETQFPQPCPPEQASSGVSTAQLVVNIPGEAPQEFTITVTGGLGETHLPQTGIGFRRDGPPGEAPEVDAVLTEERVNTVGVELGFGFPVGGIGLRLGVSYEEGDAANSFDIPGNAGIDSGRVNGALSPAGSSGVATDRGLTGGTEVEASRLDVVLSTFVLRKGRIGASPIPNVPYNMNELRPSLSADVSIWYGISDQLDVSNISYSGGGGFVFQFSQDRRQRISEQYFGVIVGAEAAIPLGRRLVGHLNGRVSGYYRDSDLDSVERNLCNFCPVSDRDFTIEIRDSNDGWGFRGQAGTDLELRVSPRFSFFAGGSADYWSDVGAIFNPNSGDQVFFEGLTTELRTEDAWSWRVGAGIRYAFGR